MSRCVGTVQDPKSPNFGNQCQRSAVAGATFCGSHGGISSPAARVVSQKLKRPAVRCRSLRRDGKPCKRFASPFSIVCVKHGGNLPSVRQAAERARREFGMRALAAVDQILDDVFNKPDMSDSDRLKAVIAVLDRTGYGARSEVEVTVRPWEKTVQGIMRSVPPGEIESGSEGDEEVVEGEVVEDGDGELEEDEPANVVSIFSTDRPKPTVVGSNERPRRSERPVDNRPDFKR